MSSHRTRGTSNSCGPEMDGQWVNTRKIGISLCPQVRRKWGKVSNLVYQPTSLPPSPEAAADATTLRDLQRARALAAAPPRPEEKAADPADPSPAGSGPATQTPGTKARGVCSQPLEGRGRTQREGQGREGRRSRYLAGRHSAASSFSLSGDAPGRGPSARLRGSRGGCSGEAAGRALSRGYRPLARPALRHHLYAPRLDPGARSAAECLATAECSAAARGAGPLPSPGQAEGPAEGRGRRPRSLGFAPPRARRTRSHRLPTNSPPASGRWLHSAPR